MFSQAASNIPQVLSATSAYPYTYTYSSVPSSSSSTGGIVFFIIALLVVIAIWAAITSIFVQLAREKGHHDKTGKVWACGILCSPILAALYVIAMPDKEIKETIKAGTSSNKPANDELPSI